MQGGWDLSPEQGDLVRVGFMQGVDAQMASARPVGWWASKTARPPGDVATDLRALADLGILTATASRDYVFTAAGFVHVRGLVEAGLADPFGGLGQPDLLMVGTTAQHGGEVIDAARRCCPHLMFYEDGIKNAWRAIEPLDELALVLDVLNEMAEAADEGGSLGMSVRKWVAKCTMRRKCGGLTYAESDSKTTKDLHTLERRIVIDDKLVVLDEHFTMGSDGNLSKTLNVYFTRHPRLRRTIVIGYVGPHLPLGG